jgi:hypothetical protein
MQSEPISAPSRMIGAHSDQYSIPDRAGVNDCPMTTGYLITDDQGILICHMQDGPVLNVGPVPDLDEMNVGSDYGLIPDTGVFADNHCSHQAGGRGHKSRFGDGRWTL